MSTSTLPIQLTWGPLWAFFRGPDTPTRILPGARRSSAPSPAPSIEHPYEVDDHAVTVDPQGRIVVTLRSRHGRLIGCYAVPVGRSAVVARDILGRPSEPAVSQYPTTLPPAPEAPVDPGVAPLAHVNTNAANSAAMIVWACGTVIMAILAVLALRGCEPLHPEPIPQPAYRVAP